MLTTVAILALLTPSMITILPVKAKVTIIELGPGPGFEVWLIDEGEVWEAGGMLHMKDSYWEGPGREQWVKHLSLNLETGKGTFRVKWFSGVPEAGADGKAARGKITDWNDISGTYECHGVGVFEGWKFMGSFEGEIKYDGDGVPTYMKFVETGIALIPPSSPNQPQQG